MQSTASPLSAPLRRTPPRFQVLVALGALLVVAGYVVVLRNAPGPGLTELATEPGFVLLALLVLLADLYPLVPWMRDVRANVTFAWSAALSLAAVLAYGPAASVLFLVSGLTAALSRRSGRWWRPVVNMIVFGLIGLAVAGLAALGPSGDPPPPLDPLSLTVWGMGLAVVIVVLNAVLIGIALTALGVVTWHDQYERFGKALRIWGVSLITAPLLAALALDGPWALPSMAIVIVSLNHLSRSLFRSNAQARIDTLTGLANRLTLIRRLSARIARLGPRDPGVVLLLIDLNHFKDVNDTYGHLVGDEVLVAVAHRLQAAAGPADLVARYGGDEFAMVLGPGATADSAHALAARLSDALAEEVIAREIRVQIGGSIGFAIAHDPRIDVLGLVEQADQDMYRAKWARHDTAPLDRRTLPRPPGAVVVTARLVDERAGFGVVARRRLAGRALVGDTGRRGRGGRAAGGPHQPGHPVTDQINPLAIPFRRTPVVFRWWLVAVVLAAIAGFVLLGAFAPGPPAAEILTQTGLIILIGLILLADLYPTLPWMRDSNPFDEFILSTPLALAALMVFGPHAAFVFLITGIAITVPLRMVWWRVVLNIALWGLQGVLAASVLALITGDYDWSDPMPVGWMLALSAALGIVIEVSNVLLVGRSLTLLGAFSWRDYVSDWRSQVAIGSLALTAPIPAVLAQHDPALLPLLALAMIAAQSGISAIASRAVLAGSDPLTSVANRATLVTRLRHRLAALRRPTDSVTLLLVDLDGFKAVNDLYGHLAGDRVLVEIAQRLEASTRSADLVARFGGDEFAILLAEGVPVRTAEDVALRVRDAVARPIEIGDRVVAIGASVGWATAVGEPFEAQALLARADAELYRAKAARQPRFGHRVVDGSRAGAMFSGSGSSTALVAGADPPDGPASTAAGSVRWADPVWTRTDADAGRSAPAS